MILKRKIQNCTEQCYSSHEVTMLRLLSHEVLSYMWLRTEVRVQKNGIDKELVWMAISGKESILYRQWKCSYLLVLGCKIIILTDGVNFILVQLQNVVEVKPLFCKNLWTVGLNQYTYIRLQIINGNISSKILLFDTTCAENSLKSVYWWIGAYIPGCKTGS